MRTISADNGAILAGRPVASYRIQVKDSGGTFRDLSTYPGLDMIAELSWGEDLDSPGVSWSATLTREQESISLAPFMTNSPLNRGFNPAASYAALLQVGREMKVEYAIQAEDDPRALTWALAFAGYVDSVDSGGADDVKLAGRGLEAAIINAFAKRERIYAFAQGGNADRGCYVWTPSTTWVVGDRVLPTDSKRNDHFYRVTTGGAGGTVEPAWPTGGGSTVVDGAATFTESGATSTSTGTAVETIMQQILDDNLGAGAVTLQVPSSPGWAIRWFLVGRQPVFDELVALAGQIGWCLRYLYSGTSTSKLTLFDPLRSTTTSLRTFQPAEVEQVGMLKTEWRDIRNNGVCIFCDSQDLDPAGNPKRKTVTATDSASVTKYGDLFFELSESSTSNIDTTAEATALLAAVLSDLSEPTAEIEVSLLYFFAFVELCDLYTLAANGVQFDTDQKMAVSSYSHHVGSGGESSTTFKLRGKPASNGKKGWFELLSDAQGADVHQLTVIENVSPITLTADTTPVGGARLEFTWGGSKALKETQTELHLSTSSGFTPSSATLVSVGAEGSREVGNLDPAKTYYAKIVPLVRNASKPVRGQPSAEISFVPGRGQATHLDPNVDWGRLPLNGGFETQFDPAAPPDFWFNGIPGGLGSPGTWGVNAFMLTDANGCSGANYLKLLTTGGSGAGVSSAEFSINEFETYKASVWRNNQTGTGAGACVIGVIWYDYTHAAISDSSEVWDIATSVGTWVKHTTAALTPLAGARFARMYLFVNPTAGRETWVDDARLVMQ